MIDDCGSAPRITTQDKVVKDEKKSQWAMDWEARERQEKADLIWAAKTRILTEQEMERVRSLGTYLVTPLMQSYRQEDVDRQFNDLMLQQFRMREIKAKVEHGKSSREIDLPTGAEGG